ncbi:MAG: aromatic amino acid transaminase [Simkaniaceae bacterium]|nr:aromatic amino acid transaminase [Simkaniaceae bacterium]
MLHLLLAVGYTMGTMSILAHVKALPADPIFGLAKQIESDSRKGKVDLTVGIYYDEHLRNRKLDVVAEAEARLLRTEENKAYLPITGNSRFIDSSRSLVFGEGFASAERGRFIGAQAVGGTHALRLGAELLKREVTHRLLLSSPTWPNHLGIFGECGMEVTEYPYYDPVTHASVLSKMSEKLGSVPERSIVLLHVCCHNPTGCDPTKEEWKALSSLMLRKRLIPFFDFAYQGFARGLEEDAWPVRYFASEGHELFVAHSFSKTFGLYGERVGALHCLLRDRETAERGDTVLQRLIRTTLSNPPLHGAAIVTEIVSDPTLKGRFVDELAAMRSRIMAVRTMLIEALATRFGEKHFAFLRGHRGMFSILDLSDETMRALRKEWGVYLTRGGRVNLTGLNEVNLPRFVDALARVIAS